MQKLGGRNFYWYWIGMFFISVNNGDGSTGKTSVFAGRMETIRFLAS